MEPMFRTRITYEVITVTEAFNGTPDELASMIRAGDAVATVYDRAVHEMDAYSVMNALAERSE